jgi:hypothetical protein
LAAALESSKMKIDSRLSAIPRPSWLATVALAIATVPSSQPLDFASSDLMLRAS